MSKILTGKDLDEAICNIIWKTERTLLLVSPFIKLSDYSFKNNIEFGVFSQQSILDGIALSSDNEAWKKCMDIDDTTEVVFIKRPVFESKRRIINLGKYYVKSDILFDSADKFYGYNRNKKADVRRLADSPEEIELGSVASVRPERKIEEKKEKKYGYCIRSGTKIKFNPRHPMSIDSWKTWIEYGNEDFHENYCHKTGNKS